MSVKLSILHRSLSFLADWFLFTKKKIFLWLCVFISAKIKYLSVHTWIQVFFVMRYFTSGDVVIWKLPAHPHLAYFESS